CAKVAFGTKLFW
nr:immunoglobulin heavy chain junction region [Macaca mulatta]